MKLELIHDIANTAIKDKSNWLLIVLFELEESNQISDMDECVPISKTERNVSSTRWGRASLQRTVKVAKGDTENLSPISKTSRFKF